MHRDTHIRAHKHTALGRMRIFFWTPRAVETRVNSAARRGHAHSLEFHEIHDIFFEYRPTRGCASTIHDIKLLPAAPLALRGRFNPIDFKSRAQRSTVNCEDVSEKNVPEHWDQMEYRGSFNELFAREVKFTRRRTWNFLRDTLPLFPSPFQLNSRVPLVIFLRALKYTWERERDRGKSFVIYICIYIYIILIITQLFYILEIIAANFTHWKLLPGETIVAIYARARVRTRFRIDRGHLNNAVI